MLCPKCSTEMDELSLIAMDHGRGSIEMDRFDCPKDGCDTTVLVGATSEMGDQDDEAEED